MQLEHIALNILHPQEIENFYQNILGMTIIKNFTIGKDLAEQFFNISKDTLVYLMQKDDLLLELFVNERNIGSDFNHICITVTDREKIVKNANNNSYKCIRRKRDFSDQIFISDKSGNIFEIKEIS